MLKTHIAASTARTSVVYALIAGLLFTQALNLAIPGFAYAGVALFTFAAIVCLPRRFTLLARDPSWWWDVVTTKAYDDHSPYSSRLGRVVMDGVMLVLAALVTGVGALTFAGAWTLTLSVPAVALAVLSTRAAAQPTGGQPHPWAPFQPGEEIGHMTSDGVMHRGVILACLPHPTDPGWWGVVYERRDTARRLVTCQVRDTGGKKVAHHGASHAS